MFAALPPAPPAAVVVTAPSVAASDSHRVRPGDTVGGVALRYGVTRGELRAANDIGADNLIRIGERLTIPTKGASSTQSTSSAAARQDSTGAAARSGPVRAGASMSLGAERLAARDAVVAAAREHGIDVDLALAIAWQESRWRPDAVSHAGARGVMQCMPVTGRWMSEKLGRQLDLDDVRDNATCGVMLLKTLQQSAGGDEATVLGAYYQGMTSLKQRGMYGETSRYVAQVQSHRDTIAAGNALRG